MPRVRVSRVVSGISVSTLYRRVASLCDHDTLAQAEIAHWLGLLDINMSRIFRIAERAQMTFEATVGKQASEPKLY